MFGLSPPHKTASVAIGLLAAAWSIFPATPAYATAEIHVDLVYVIDETLKGCPTAEEFRAHIAQQIGTDPFRADATLRTEIHAKAVLHGIYGTIDWNTPGERKLGERRFTSRNQNCHELMTTMGFVVAVQLQLLATDRKDEVKADPVQAPLPPAPSPPATPPPTRSPWSFFTGLGPSISLGLGPDPIAQGRVFVAAHHGMAGLELGAEATLPANTRQLDGSGFRHHLLLGTMAACARHRPLALCALGKVGKIQVQGLGVDAPSSPSGLFAQLGPRAALTLELGERTIVFFHTEALFLLTPWTVNLNQLPTWTMSRYGASLGIDLAIRFR